MLTATSSVIRRYQALLNARPALAPSGAMAEPCVDSGLAALWDEGPSVVSPADYRRLQALRIRTGSRKHTWFNISQVETLSRGVPV